MVTWLWLKIFVLFVCRIVGKPFRTSVWATRNLNIREKRKWKSSGNYRLGLIPQFSKDPKQLQIQLNSLCQGLGPIPDPPISRLAAVSWGMFPESALSPWSLVPKPVLFSECCRHRCVATTLSQAALCLCSSIHLIWLCHIHALIHVFLRL